MGQWQPHFVAVIVTLERLLLGANQPFSGDFSESRICTSAFPDSRRSKHRKYFILTGRKRPRLCEYRLIVIASAARQSVSRCFH
jgi:hypothetical protein